MGRLGIEIDTATIRAIRLEPWRRRTPRVTEAAWDPANPAEAVHALRASLGRARRVGVAVRLPLLFTKRVKLPPLAAAERRRVLELEPQRFFPVRGEEVVVTTRPGHFVFAAREAPITGWARALEELGPVDIVEPGPVALARALQSGGIGNGLAVIDDGEHGVSVIEIRNGQVEGARRVYRSLPDVVLPLTEDSDAPRSVVYLAPWDEGRAHDLRGMLAGRTVEPLPAVARVPAAFLAAYGAALGVGRRLDDALLPEELKARVVARRRRELAAAALLCAASAAFALTSVDTWRAAAGRDIAERNAALKNRAGPVLALQDEIATRRQRAAAIAQIEAERPDPLLVMRALSQRLPTGAHLRSLSLSGADWQIDGYAPQAAQVTQSLGSAGEFKNVHVLSATNRSRLGDRTYESFSVAFRFAPTP